MNTLTPSECELVTGGFRLHPRAAVDCAPFEDVLREADASITLGLSIEPTPADGNGPPVVMGKLNPKVSQAVRARSLRSE